MGHTSPPFGCIDPVRGYAASMSPFSSEFFQAHVLRVYSLPILFGDVVSVRRLPLVRVVDSELLSNVFSPPCFCSVPRLAGLFMQV